MLENAAKDLRRLRQIVRVIGRYGYGELVKRTPQMKEALSDGESAPPSNGDLVAQGLSAPRRFRLLLEELGPTFIKLGQVLSSRPDLVSRAYVEELKSLQYQCVPLEFDEIEQAIEDGLGVSPAERFASIDPRPLATASIAQVHRAITKDGAQVVVKVQRPGIKEEMRADIDILYRVASLLDAVIEESGVTDPVGVIREFEKAMIAELDFTIEAANVREFRKHHEGRDDVVIPAVHDELSTETVLTMDFLDGVPFTKLPPDADRKKIAERTVREAFDEVFIDGFFHADPHPGNLLLLKDGRYGILDFGLCGRLTPQMRETLVVLSLAVALRDADTAARTLYRLGQADARVNISDLRDDLSALFHKYLGKRIVEVEAELVMQELLNLAVRHKIRVPPEYAMLGRASATIEGLIREFDPDLDVAKIAAPYAEKLLLERVAPTHLEGGLYKLLLQFQGLSEDVPLQLAQIMSDLSAGNFATSIKGPAIEKLNTTLLISAAAISGSIMGAAFVIGSFIAFARLDWKVLGVPVVGMFGAIAGAVIFSWVSAYVVFRPRLKKISLTSIFGRKRGP